MPEKTMVIHHEVGLHARPASVFVKTASKFSSNITIIYGDHSVNAKSILGVLTLGVHKDAEIIVSAEGADASEALEALENLVNGNFGETK